MSEQRNGKPLSIININKDHSYTTNNEALTEILMNENVKDREIVLISVAGAYRKGKSFLLDFFLRYLYAQYVDHDTSNWLGDKNAPLTGFSWRGGSEKETNGIFLWSEAFLYDSPNGDKLAIVLMDTQGLFDNQSTTKDCVTIFSISTLLSSVQIYNLWGNIQENDLQSLQLFTEFGKMASNQYQKKAFQKLSFLIRDWSNAHEFPFGYRGGNLLLEKKLAVDADQAEELQSVRKHIKNTYGNINCFLMPHPGFEASENPKFTGKVSDLRKDFVEHLRKFIIELLKPEKLIPKKIGGKVLKGSDVFEYLQNYIKLFNEDKLPPAKSFYEATTKAQNLEAKMNSQTYYTEAIHVEKAKLALNSIQELDDLHSRLKTEAIKRFNEAPKLGSQEDSNKYRAELDKDIEKIFKPIRAAAVNAINNRPPPPRPRSASPPLEVQIVEAITAPFVSIFKSIF